MPAKKAKPPSKRGAAKAANGKPKTNGRATKAAKKAKRPPISAKLKAATAAATVNFLTVPQDVYIVYRRNRSNKPRYVMRDPILFYSKDRNEVRAYLAQFSEEERQELNVDYNDL